MGASRIANVTAAWLGGFGAARSTPAAASTTAALFEDTIWIGAEAPSEAPEPGSDATGARLRRVPFASGRRDFVSGLATAIVAARSERVVVMPDGATSAGAELALALVAWPEHTVVLVVDDAGAAGSGASYCGIHRRADLLERSRAALDTARPVPSLAAFLSGLEVARVDLARLGLGERPLALFDASEAG